MYCKWCGMDSRDDQKCEWCHRPFVSGGDPQATTAVPPVTPAAPTPTQQMPAQPRVIPALGDPGATQSPAQMPVGTPLPQEEQGPLPNYLSQPTPAGSEVTTAVTPVPDATQAVPRPGSRAALAESRIPAVEREELPPYWMRLEKYLGVMLPLLAIGMAIAHAFPDQWYVPFFVLLPVSGLFMAIFRAIGFYDDNYAGVLVLLLVAAVVGPVYATIVAVLSALIRQDMNFSMLGLMLSFFVIRLAIGGAAHGLPDTFDYMIEFTVSVDMVGSTLKLFPLCLLFGGWMSASFAQPLDQ